MVVEPLVAAHGLLEQAVAAVEAACGPGAGDADLLSALTFCEGVSRQMERLGVTALAGLMRRGVFAERGYASASKALTDLMGVDWAEARRRALVAEQAVARVGLDGEVLPARLAATAEIFAAGGCSSRAVEVIARVLATPAAQRLSPELWAATEERLAAVAGAYSPADLQAWGGALVETLDQDGPEPDDLPSAQINELHLTRHAAGSGGRIRGRFDDPAMFAAIAAAVDAHAAPRTADDDRSAVERQAEALADVCSFALDHAEAPARGGERPRLSVIVRLEDLENRARAGCLLVRGPPRRHHVVPWENGGPTSLANCCMLCRSCHRLVHHGGWDVHLREGVPEFFPPTWIDPSRSPRGRPRHLAPVA